MIEAEVKELIEDLSGSRGQKREKARKELVKIGVDIIPYLESLANSKKHKTRWEAVKALGEIGHKKAISLLIHALEDEKSDVRWLAAEGLVFAGIESIYPLLLSLEEKYKSMHFRNGVHHVFKEFKDFDLPEEFDELMHSLEKYINLESIPVLAEKLRDKIKKP